jgi:hypothetical protein
MRKNYFRRRSRTISLPVEHYFATTDFSFSASATNYQNQHRKKNAFHISCKLVILEFKSLKMLYSTRDSDLYILKYMP